MAMTWAEVQQNIDTLGIPPLMPCAEGFAEPEDVFFDCATWQWMGRTVRKSDGEPIICRQLSDGRWITQRVATDDDNARIEAARAARVCAHMEAIR